MLPPWNCNNAASPRCARSARRPQDDLAARRPAGFNLEGAHAPEITLRREFDLLQRLDPKQFMRVHRSIIVRLDLVEALEREAVGDSVLLLKGGIRLRVSRTRREAVERWLGLIE